jgi:hypothetical protein
MWRRPDGEYELQNKKKFDPASTTVPAFRAAWMPKEK